jgi:hypothetical protein
MVKASFIALFLAIFAVWPLMAAFLRAVRRESPEIYESWGRPTLAKYLRQRQLITPFSAKFLFRTYREQLRDCPHSRAWGSWLALAYWIQWVAIVGLIVGFARRYI